MGAKPMKTAVVGCGAISDIYLTNMIHRFENIEVVACCAKHFERAQRKAAQYGVRACEYAQILDDPEIELVVILTPAPTHYELIRAALLRSKHVYTEKTMTIALDQAAELLEIARERGLYLGSAPDTFLGAALSTARRAIEEGRIGRVSSFAISANRDLDALAARFSFLRMPGGGICYDYGVYYLTALVSLLGPIRRAAALVENRRPLREHRDPASPDFGKTYAYDNESQVTAILQTEGGVSGSFMLSGDSVGKDQSVFMIYGERGILRLPCPDYFGGEVTLLPNVAPGEPTPEPIALDYGFDFSENSRGVGPSEMVDAIRENRPCRASGELAYHVLAVIEQIMRSAQTHRFEEIPHAAAAAASRR